MTGRPLNLAAIRANYEANSASQDRLDWLTDQTLLQQLRAFKNGKRKSLSAKLIRRLADYAAFIGRTPVDPQIRMLVETLVRDWNHENPYGEVHTLRGPAISTTALVDGFEGSTGTKRGHKERTRAELLSTRALDAAATELRPHCPHAWCYSGNDADRTTAETWLLGMLRQIEPQVTPAIVRAIIQRTVGS